jgi:hypothetical protein
MAASTPGCTDKWASNSLLSLSFVSILCSGGTCETGKGAIWGKD